MFGLLLFFFSRGKLVSTVSPHERVHPTAQTLVVPQTFRSKTALPKEMWPLVRKGTSHGVVAATGVKPPGFQLCLMLVEILIPPVLPLWPTTMVWGFYTNRLRADALVDHFGLNIWYRFSWSCASTNPLTQVVPLIPTSHLETERRARTLLRKGTWARRL